MSIPARLIARMMSGAGLAALLAGCATTAPDAELAAATPVRSTSVDASRTDVIYSSAVTAIDRRDYVRALDLLQIARRENARDVRVLNALGVVYDKLGRFDLSRRYYAEAAQVDPVSPVVQANIAYSERLQAQASGGILLAEAPIIKVAPPEPPARPETAAGPVRVVADAPAPATLRAGPERENAPGVPDLATRILAALDLSEPSAPAADAPARGAVEAPLQLQPADETRRLAAGPERAAPLHRVKLVSRPQHLRSSAPEVAEAPAPERERRGLVSRLLAGLGLGEAEPAPGAPPEASFDLANLEPVATQRLDVPAHAWPWLAPRMRTPGSADIQPPEEEAAPSPFALAQAPADPPATTDRPPALRLAQPTLALQSVTPAWPGIRIVDASGQYARAEPVRMSLASLGWTAPRRAVAAASPQGETVIIYPARRAAVAAALARTLPGYARLESCGDTCGGLQLVLGSDSRSWGPLPRPVAIRSKKVSA